MEKSGKGAFIVLEGIEGAGKSTAIRTVSDFLTESGRKVKHTREPGGTPLAEELRNAIKHEWQEKVLPVTEIFVMYAARAQLVENVIRPALAEGTFVVGDRHDLSTVAYQGGGRGVELSVLRTARHMAIGDFRPDLTFLLDISPELGFERVRKRAEASDRFENERLEFFRRVRQAYLDAAAEDSSIEVVDASRTETEVCADIRQRLEVFLCSRG
jgi:dTMP kinase